MVYLEIAIVVVLTVLNGVLAMSELALMSSRKSRLEQLARDGRAGAAVALRLAEDPGRFLSTVQIGITLVGVVAGAYGGTTLGERLGAWLDRFDWIAPHGPSIAVPVVVILITYLSLIVGELVPKRIALVDPEGVASAVARPMRLLSRIAAPAVWLLDRSSILVLRLLRLDRERETRVTEDEVRALIAEGTRTGIFAEKEQELIEGVIRTADRTVRSVMTPRSEIGWIDVDADLEAILKLTRENDYARLLVCEGSIDEAIGVVHTKDIVPAALSGEPIDLRALMTPPLVVPDRTPVLRLIEVFRREGVHLAVVVDEYGTTEGIVTATDVLEAIAGELPEHGDDEDPMVVARPDGSLLVDGMLPIDVFETRIGATGLRGEGSYETVAGLVLERLGHIPAAGESVTIGDLDLEVVDMDGRRIDKLLVVRRTAEGGDTVSGD